MFAKHDKGCLVLKFGKPRKSDALHLNYSVEGTLQICGYNVERTLLSHHLPETMWVMNVSAVKAPSP